MHSLYMYITSSGHKRAFITRVLKGRMTVIASNMTGESACHFSLSRVRLMACSGCCISLALLFQISTARARRQNVRDNNVYWRASALWVLKQKWGEVEERHSSSSTLTRHFLQTAAKLYRTWDGNETRNKIKDLTVVAAPGNINL